MAEVLRTLATAAARGTLAVLLYATPAMAGETCDQRCKDDKVWNAADWGDVPALQAALKAGGSPNAKGDGLYSPAPYQAAVQCRVDAIRELHKANADLSAQYDGVTPLARAERLVGKRPGCDKVVEFLKSIGASR